MITLRIPFITSRSTTHTDYYVIIMLFFIEQYMFNEVAKQVSAVQNEVYFLRYRDSIKCFLF